jgi:hypothetical protein
MTRIICPCGALYDDEQGGWVVPHNYQHSYHKERAEEELAQRRASLRKRRGRQQARMAQLRSGKKPEKKRRGCLLGKFWPF